MEKQMDPLEAVNEIAKACDGKITEVGILPDNSGFAIMSMPLREDHWIYGDRSMERKVCDTSEGELFSEPPPMVMRMGAEAEMFFGVRGKGMVEDMPFILTRRQMADLIRKAGKYAVRAATMKGKEMDFDPDALLQNLVVGFLGYWTEDGLTDDEWGNPPQFKKDRPS
jgi:hypothetical protein